MYWQLTDRSQKHRWVFTGHSTLGVALVLAAIGCADDAANSELRQVGAHLTAARNALASGDDQTALAELNKSINIEASTWAYIERARLQMRLGDEQAAHRDIEAGLALTPDSRELRRLEDELKKPATQRTVIAAGPEKG